MAVAVKKGVYVVAGKRTPFGKYGGLLRDVLAEDLFATAATAALKAGDVPADLVDTVNIGQISTISQTGLSCRHASLKAGIPAERPVLGMNRLSGSAFDAIICSAQEILLGSAQISVAGGMENLSSIPYLFRDVRFGTELRKTTEMEDFLRKGYYDTHCNMFLPLTADVVAAKYGVTRGEADEYALRSQQKWKHADATGIFDEELVPVPIKQKNREALMTRDEHPQPDITLEKLSRLPPVVKGGVTTAGNATIHEIYAATTLVCARELAVDDRKLNVNGGAIAIGHPSGASGARIISHLTYELRRRGLKRALASASIAGGQGVAMMIETV